MDKRSLAAWHKLFIDSPSPAPFCCCHLVRGHLTLALPLMSALNLTSTKQGATSRGKKQHSVERHRVLVLYPLVLVRPDIPTECSSSRLLRSQHFFVFPRVVL